MKIAVITRPTNRSPKILALSLKNSLEHLGIETDIFYKEDFLRRLLPLGKKSRGQLKLHFRMRRKMLNYFTDHKIINKFKEYDAIIVSECIPNAYWKGFYALEELKKIIKKPLGLYEVYFLDAAPNHIKSLKENNDFLQDAYDFHLALSKVSYTKTEISEKKFEVGINLESFGLKPTEKKEFSVLLDFADERTKKQREEQKNVLRSLKIPFVELKGEYSVAIIRKLYQAASAFMIQKYEAFGLPIAECLSYGTKVITPDGSWPSAFRLEANPQYYGAGELANCFMVYTDADDLKKKLSNFKQHYSLEDTPKAIFRNFETHYSKFYRGSDDELMRLVNSLTKNK